MGITDNFRIKTLDKDQADQVVEYEPYIDNYLCKIKPYYYNYKAFCKERWRDKKLVDIFTKEFRDRPSEYYVEVIQKGGVIVDGQPSTLDTIVRNGDIIIHKVHRHEPPVSSKPIRVVFQDDDLMAIDKPSGIPVHPTGRYRYNTVTKIIERQFNGLIVHPCNRLDTLTSGLMMLAKTRKGADKLAIQLQNREVEKMYIAQVKGEFPAREEIIVDKPLKVIDRKVSLNAVALEDTDRDAKESVTIFKRISYDGKTSIVQCRPLTGRTHQIRVHLQYLGFPIANDPIYSNKEVWGESLGKGGLNDFDGVISKLDILGKTNSMGSWMYPYRKSKDVANYQMSKCLECNVDIPPDPSENELELWLHAYCYKSKDSLAKDDSWVYKTLFPSWAVLPHFNYMELALEQAKKCTPTETAFSAGAILVHGSGILEVGYSRELPGDTHAEHCAMEKYFAKIGKRELPIGTTLYSTLNPCSFDSNNHKSCIDRLLEMGNAIETVFVGVAESSIFEPNNNTQSRLESAGISYVHVPGYEKECIQIATKGHTSRNTV